MLGLGALGEFALGEGPTSSVILLAARASGQARSRVAGSITSALLGRTAAQAKVRTPGGVALPGRIRASAALTDAPTTRTAVQGLSAARAYVKAGPTVQSAISGLARASSRGADAPTVRFAAQGRIAAMAEMRTPGGAGLSGRVKAQAALSFDLHMEIKNVPTRRALLLNSASTTASYWKGHS